MSPAVSVTRAEEEMGCRIARKEEKEKTTIIAKIKILKCNSRNVCHSITAAGCTVYPSILPSIICRTLMSSMSGFETFNNDCKIPIKSFLNPEKIGLANLMNEDSR